MRRRPGRPKWDLAGSILAAAGGPIVGAEASDFARFGVVGSTKSAPSSTGSRALGPKRERRKRRFKERAHCLFLSAFPILRLTVEGTVAESDEVVVRSSVRGTHLGDGQDTWHED